MQLSAIEEDESLTRAQTFEQIKAKLDTYSEQLKALLFATKPHGPRGGPHGGPRGGKGGRGGFPFGGRGGGRFGGNNGNNNNNNGNSGNASGEGSDF